MEYICKNNDLHSGILLLLYEQGLADITGIDHCQNSDSSQGFWLTLHTWSEPRAEMLDWDFT